MGLAPSERARMWKEYVAALEEERRKIQVFSKELPLCLDLVVQTIESYRKHLEERGDAGLELEEFIPMNSTSGSDEGKEKNSMESSSEISKADWLRSAQLWSCSDQLKDIGDADKEKKTAEDGGQSLHRKARRSWLPDLHQSFLHALDQLGGPDVATPKQIREKMNVDGLTNDEVKSHLQKYRLHSKRPRSPAITGSRQTPPVVFGVWMPPPGYAAMATAAMASVPLDLNLFDHKNHPQLHRKKRQRRTDEGEGSFFLQSHE